MARIEMNSHDMEDLYILLRVYQSAYGEEDVKHLLVTLAEKYNANTGGMDISIARNPRMAGRPEKYSTEVKNRIAVLKRNGLTLREIATETGCSLGYVHGVVSRFGKEVSS